MLSVTRKDPVKFRVALPAADPPDNAQSRLKIPVEYSGRLI
jgi:hypothetical protein